MIGRKILYLFVSELIYNEVKDSKRRQALLSEHLKERVVREILEMGPMAVVAEAWQLNGLLRYTEWFMLVSSDDLSSIDRQKHRPRTNWVDCLLDQPDEKVRHTVRLEMRRLAVEAIVGAVYLDHVSQPWLPVCPCHGVDLG